MRRTSTAWSNRYPPLRALERELDDAVTMIGLAEEEGDKSLLRRGRSLARAACAAPAEAMKIESIALGRGGTPMMPISKSMPARAVRNRARMWASILFRDVHRWAERRGFQMGNRCRKARAKEAGLKSATIQVRAVNAYGTGWKTETGVASPCAASRPSILMRAATTSFASVGVFPVIGRQDRNRGVRKGMCGM